MNIFGITFTQGARAAAAVRSTGAVETAKATQATQGMGIGQVHDQVDLSVDGVRAAQTASDIRFDRVQSIRTAIAEGSYETPEKLDLALERLLDRIS
ncbi:MAG: flagellar biosynthesis anti-sigma factor FlgM [Planctomycetaceae bacterium]|jgi:anti-sigma28 factor (negative regulator of flagellin synthesis)|nr:flagellar biosynthesis anti-sigma factor FlgM [Planctomycetota bacterium]MSR26771.1 flagellar biosynthesis anti-sigma factor FlgM [Planctomycetaceae bacterium]